MTRHQRPDKFDRLTKHKASRADDLGHHVIGPFDRRSAAADLKWGCSRLPELVSPETAVIWANTMANLNEAIRGCYEPDDEKQALANLKGCVESGIRGFDYMDAEADRTGQPKADTRVFEYVHEGAKIGVMADDDAWPAIKSQRPDLRLYTMREVAVALQLIADNPAVAAIKEHFPDAKVTAIRPKSPVSYSTGGDPIPF